MALAVLAMLLGLGRNAFFPGGISLVETAGETGFPDTVHVEIDLVTGYRYYQQGVQFIDARAPGKYAAGHIPGSINLPADASLETKSAAADTLPPEGTYVIYCNDPACNLGDVVYEFLRMMGFETLHIMTAGFDGWQNAGYPVNEGG